MLDYSSQDPSLIDSATVYLLGRLEGYCPYFGTCRNRLPSLETFRPETHSRFLLLLPPTHLDPLSYAHSNLAITFFPGLWNISPYHTGDHIHLRNKPIHISKFPMTFFNGKILRLWRWRKHTPWFVLHGISHHALWFSSVRICGISADRSTFTKASPNIGRTDQLQQLRKNITRRELKWGGGHTKITYMG